MFRALSSKLYALHQANSSMDTSVYIALKCSSFHVFNHQHVPSLKAHLTPMILHSSFLEISAYSEH